MKGERINEKVVRIPDFASEKEHNARARRTYKIIYTKKHFNNRNFSVIIIILHTDDINCIMYV